MSELAAWIRRWLQGTWVRSLAILALLLMTSFAGGQEAKTDELGGLPLIVPETVYTYPDIKRVVSVQATDDPDFVIASWTAESIDLWLLAVRHAWHPVIALASLFLLVFAWRVWRRPQMVGQPYCRRCNYCLTNLDSERCPECGSNLIRRGRLMGRRRWPRLLVVAALLTVLGTADYKWRNSWIRQDLFAESLSLCSIRLHDWANIHDYQWLLDARRRIAKIARFDLRDGSMGRILESRPGVFSIQFRASADGRSIYINRGLSVVRIDTTTGRDLGSFPQPDEANRTTRFETIDSFVINDDETKALIIRTFGSVERIDLTTGKLERLFKLEYSEDGIWSRNIVSSHRTNRVCLVSWQRQANAFDGRMLDARTFEVLDDIGGLALLPTRDDPYWQFLTHDDWLLYFSDESEAVTIRRLKGGDLDRIWTLPVAYSNWGVRIDDSGELLFLPLLTNIGTLVFDLRNERSLAILSNALQSRGRIIVKRDEGRVILGNGNSLCIYDISKVLDD